MVLRSIIIIFIFFTKRTLLKVCANQAFSHHVMVTFGRQTSNLKKPKINHIDQDVINVHCKYRFNLAFFCLFLFSFITTRRHTYTRVTLLMFSPTQLPAVSESRLRICWRAGARLAGKAGLLQNRDQGQGISLGGSPGLCGLSSWNTKPTPGLSWKTAGGLIRCAGEFQPAGPRFLAFPCTRIMRR